MSSKYLFVKRTSLSRRLFMWGGPLLLLVILWPAVKTTGLKSYSNLPTTIKPPVTFVDIQEPVQPRLLESSAEKTNAKPQNTTQNPSPTQARAYTQAQALTSSETRPTEADATSQQPPPNEDTALRQALNQWRQAWSAKAIAEYLSWYGPDFVSPKGLDRQAWEASRKERITRKEKIEITIQDLRLQINENTATAKFTQVYTDERLRMTDRKTLVWQKRNGRWLIQHETTD